MRGNFLALSFAAFMATSSAMAADIPAIKDFRQEAKLSQEKRVPILVMFSAENCVYCMHLEEDFLKPMQNGGFYDNKVIIRRLKMGSDDVIDFDGSRITIDALAQRYSVSVTPTLVFLDSRGHQLTQKMVGLTTPELYGGYLDQAIDTSLDRLRRNKPLVAKIPGE